MLVDDPGSPLREQERVERWRLSVLLEAGYPYEHAAKIAGRTDIDLHRAVDLVRNGCNPDIAARILL